MDKLLFLLSLLKSILILYFIFKCSVIIIYYNNIRIVYIIIYLYISRVYFIIIYYYSILRKLSKISSLIIIIQTLKQKLQMIKKKLRN